MMTRKTHGRARIARQSPMLCTPPRLQESSHTCQVHMPGPHRIKSLRSSQPAAIASHASHAAITSHATQAAIASLARRLASAARQLASLASPLLLASLVASHLWFLAYFARLAAPHLLRSPRFLPADRLARASPVLAARLTSSGLHAQHFSRNPLAVAWDSLSFFLNIKMRAVGCDQIV